MNALIDSQEMADSTAERHRRRWLRSRRANAIADAIDHVWSVALAFYIGLLTGLLVALYLSVR